MNIKPLHPIFTFLIIYLISFSIQAQNKVLIRQARMDSNAAFARHDLEGIAKHLMEEAVVIAADGTALIGSDSVISVLRNRFEKMSDIMYVRTPTEIITNDTTAWERGKWTAKRTNTKDFKPIGGNYAAMWSEENGVWKIRSELFVAL